MRMHNNFYIEKNKLLPCLQRVALQGVMGNFSSSGSVTKINGLTRTGLSRGSRLLTHQKNPTTFPFCRLLAKRGGGWPRVVPDTSE